MASARERTRDERASSLTTLLGTTASVAAGLTLLAWSSPWFATPVWLARTVGILLAVAALLLTGWAAPSHGARRPVWLLGLAGVYALLFAIELGPLTPALLCLLTLLLLTTAGIVGGYIGSLLEFPGMLMVVSYVAALADCCSVFHPDGLTAQVLKHPNALALLTLSVPVLGTEEVQSLVGIGDVAFVSLFVAGTRVTGLPVVRTLTALGAAMAMVALCTELVQRPLPALPFLGAAVLLAHPEARRIPSEHTRRIGINLTVVTLVLSVMLWSALTQAGSRGEAELEHVPDGLAQPG
jgi:hypothetical protein